MNKKHVKTFVAALVVTAAASSLEAQATRRQTPQVGQKPTTGPINIIALQSRVDQHSRVYGVSPAETIPLRPGERVRVDFVGTAIAGNGNGVERPVNARFQLAAGRDQLDLVQSGPNWFIVQAKSPKDGVAQIAYEVTGNYDMKGGMRTGRVTFKVDGQAVNPGQSNPGQIGDRDRTRWDQSRTLNDRLWRAIVGQAPSGNAATADADHIYRMGYKGVMDVARTLAEEVGGQYNNLSQDRAVQVLGDLYRGLLRREGNNNQLWDSDSGFRGNVEELRRRGYVSMVNGLVTSQEFQQANGDLRTFGSLAGENDDYDSWRSNRGRYAVPR
jgi:hypothetical protein